MEGETDGQAILDFIESAVLDHCDELDGVKDGLLENPLICDFDITTLACDSTAANSTQCLSASQIAAFQKIYDGPRNSSGHSLYPGFTFGSENELIQQTSGSLSNSFTASILQNVVFNDLSYDVNSFDWDADVALIDQRVGTLIDEISPDLSAFRARGGKLLVTQGWADPYNAATWPIDHKKQLEDAMGGDVSDWFSLFMLPGTYFPPCLVGCSGQGQPRSTNNMQAEVTARERSATSRHRRCHTPWRSLSSGSRRGRHLRPCSSVTHRMVVVSHGKHVPGQAQLSMLAETPTTGRPLSVALRASGDTSNQILEFCALNFRQSWICFVLLYKLSFCHF